MTDPTIAPVSEAALAMHYNRLRISENQEEFPLEDNNGDYDGSLKKLAEIIEYGNGGASDHEQLLFALRLGVALATPAAPANGGLPDGWKLMPIEPTEEMLKAGYESACSRLLSDDYDNSECRTNEQRSAKAFREDWSAMLAATPPIPEQETDQ